jgi:hypothetical protein
LIPTRAGTAITVRGVEFDAAVHQTLGGHHPWWAVCDRCLVISHGGSHWCLYILDR